ncbi:MAG: aminomethyl-transferring glycine dehydrogenase subunit GcvPA, partial [Candidatus Aerophobetes bacterium]|nr:aminomethyl-transferring glycine dehydrogenase subunit GcvPA [Candidatus Aerophobetes bacterium]
MISYIPNTEDDQRKMLEEIGIESIDDLFKNIPLHLRGRTKFNLPPSLSEMELVREMKKLGRKNANLDEYVSFLGAGGYDHFIPAVVEHLSSRAEFYTSYTPYQAEASQGTLQAIYEYQSLICNLFKMDTCNASVYDGATALAEAVILAHNVNHRQKVLIAKTIHPEYRQVLSTYIERTLGLSIIEIGYRDGVTDLAELEEKVDEDTSCVVVQNPNFLGCLEEVKKMEEIAHKFGSLYIVSVDPISLGLLIPPGDYNADIAVGEGQPLGNHLNFGGPYLGIFTCKKEFLRKMPGRIVGETTDKKGERGFVLTLQTREQHIRREKASSNICTNQGLNALRADIYLSTLGEEGLREVANLCLQKSHYAAEKISQIPGFKLSFNSPFFKEFSVKCPAS